MAKRFLMEHPVRGRMLVPEKKQDEYLEAGFAVIEALEEEAEAVKQAHEEVIENIEAKQEEEPKQAHEEAIENIEAKAESEEEEKPKAASKSTSKKSLGSKK